MGSANTNTLYLTANSTNLAGLTLSGTNNARRIYLNKNGGSSLAIKTATYTNSYTWWLGMTLSNCTANVYPPTNTRSLTLQGGMRTDGTINLSQGTAANFILISNSVPAISGTNLSPIETIADRIMWLEEQKSSP